MPFPPNQLEGTTDSNLWRSIRPQQHDTVYTVDIRRQPNCLMNVTDSFTVAISTEISIRGKVYAGRTTENRLTVIFHISRSALPYIPRHLATILFRLAFIGPTYRLCSSRIATTQSKDFTLARAITRPYNSGRVEVRESRTSPDKQ